MGWRSGQFLLFCLGVLSVGLQGCGGGAILLQPDADEKVSAVGGSKIVETDATKGLSFSDLVPPSLQSAFSVVEGNPQEPFSLIMSETPFTLEDPLRVVNLKTLKFTPEKANAVLLPDDNVQYPGFLAELQFIDPQSCGVLSVGAHDWVICPGSLKILLKKGVVIVNDKVLVPKQDGENFIRDVQQLIEKVVEKVNTGIKQARESSSDHKVSPDTVNQIISSSVKQVITDQLTAGKDLPEFVKAIVDSLIPRLISVNVQKLPRQNRGDPLKIQITLTKSGTFDAILGRLKSLDVALPVGFQLSSGETCSLSDVTQCVVTLEQTGASSVAGAEVGISVSSEKLEADIIHDFFTIPTEEQTDAVDAAQREAQVVEQTETSSTPSPTPEPSPSVPAPSPSSGVSSTGLTPLNLSTVLANASLPFYVDVVKTGSDYQAFYNTAGELMVVVFDGVTSIGQPFWVSLSSRGVTTKLGFPVDENGSSFGVEKMQTCLLPSSVVLASDFNFLPQSLIAQVLSQVLFFFPAVSFAQTAADLQAQIQTLQNQIAELNAQLAIVQKQGSSKLYGLNSKTGETQPISTSSFDTSGYSWVVKCPPYSGPLTQAAVASWQAKVVEWGRSSGVTTGVPGTFKINRVGLSTSGSTSVADPLVVSSFGDLSASDIFKTGTETTQPFSATTFSLDVLEGSDLDNIAVYAGAVGTAGSENQTRIRALDFGNLSSTTPEAAAYTLDVVKSAQSPASMNVVGADDVAFARFKFSTTGEPTRVASIKAIQISPRDFSATDVANNQVFFDFGDTGNQAPMVVTSSRLITITADIMGISSGSSHTLDLVVDIPESSAATDVFVIKNSDQTPANSSDAQSVSLGNNGSLSVTVTPAAAIKSVVNMGEQNQTLSKFTLTADSNETVELTKIRLSNTNPNMGYDFSTADTDLKLYDSAGNILSTGRVSSQTPPAGTPKSHNDITFELPHGILVPKDTTVKFRIEGVIVGGGVTLTSGTGTSQSVWNSEEAVMIGRFNASVDTHGIEEANTLHLNASGFSTSKTVMPQSSAGSSIDSFYMVKANDYTKIPKTATSTWGNYASVSLAEIAITNNGAVLTSAQAEELYAVVDSTNTRVGTVSVTAATTSPVTMTAYTESEAPSDLWADLPIDTLKVEFLNNSQIKITPASFSSAMGNTVTVTHSALSYVQCGSSTSGIKMVPVGDAVTAGTSKTYTLKATVCPNPYRNAGNTLCQISRVGGNSKYSGSCTLGFNDGNADGKGDQPMRIEVSDGGNMRRATLQPHQQTVTYDFNGLDWTVPLDQ